MGAQMQRRPNYAGLILLQPLFRLRRGPMIVQLHSF